MRDLIVRCRLAALAFVIAGCGTPQYAIVGGRKVARPTVSYGDGALFALQHRRAFPGVFDPTRGRNVDDGTPQGRVCGVDVRFDALWQGARLVLEGSGDVPWQHDFTHTEGLFQLSFEISELGPGHRRILGRTGGSGRTVSTEIDLDVSPDRLVGRIRMQHFALAADGGYLVGRYERHGDVEKPIDAPYAIWGRAIELDGKMVRGFSLVPLPPKS
ncbi:MAG: hypothetical protein JWM53_4180 [bacterium]|nr:hypothetical protein [bacterium]